MSLIENEFCNVLYGRRQQQQDLLCARGDGVCSGLLDRKGHLPSEWGRFSSPLPAPPRVPRGRLAEHPCPPGLHVSRPQPLPKPHEGTRRTPHSVCCSRCACGLSSSAPPTVALNTSDQTPSSPRTAFIAGASVVSVLGLCLLSAVAGPAPPGPWLCPAWPCAFSPARLLLLRSAGSFRVSLPVTSRDSSASCSLIVTAAPGELSEGKARGGSALAEFGGLAPPPAAVRLYPRQRRALSMWLVLGVCVATSHWGVICVFLMTKSHRLSCLFSCVFCQASLLVFPPPTFLLRCPSFSFWSSLHFRILWICVRCWACGP